MSEASAPGSVFKSPIAGAAPAAFGLAVGPEFLTQIDAAMTREWLITDGTGSYAAGTILGCNSRRYHGLLVAARRPPAERVVLLANVLEEFTVGARAAELATTAYPDVLHPQGFRHLAGFRFTVGPEWTFHLDGALLHKRLIPLRGRRAVALRYELLGPVAEATLRLLPLCACRSFHVLSPPGRAFDVRQEAGRVEVAGVDGEHREPVYLAAPGATFEEGHLRFHRVTYRADAARGFDHEEELFSPGAFTVTLRRGQTFDFVAAREPFAPMEITTLERAENARLAARTVGMESPLARALGRAADAFVVHGEDPARAGIIAGYPWFDCWGRDAFIALEGLTLVTGQGAEARAVLEGFGERIADGLVPNFLGATPEQDAFNSIDASLWYIHAAARYTRYARDGEYVREQLWPRVQQIIAAYEGGTRFGIRVDDDGLVTGGSPETQLTWMDAQVNGRPVTPRQGKAVEINALWYNALRVAAGMATHFGQAGAAASYQQAADRTQGAFHRLFWSDNLGWLCDCIDGETRDERLRPNQIFAVSLPHPVLEKTKWSGVFDAVRARLYTPFGLRTLTPDDPGYRGVYAGTPEARDSAYHQGTAWAWLLGPYYEAYLKVHDFAPAASRAVAAGMAVWQGHLRDACLGSISEIFDGDPPHEPRGCVAQAWSVAEILRILRLIRPDR